jgi:hypothetical protein
MKLAISDACLSSNCDVFVIKCVFVNSASLLLESSPGSSTYMANLLSSIMFYMFLYDVCLLMAVVLPTPTLMPPPHPMVLLRLIIFRTHDFRIFLHN